MNVLFIAPLPLPVTGQSVACELLFHSLLSKSNICLVDLNKKSFKQGVDSFDRVCEVLSIFNKIRNALPQTEVIYFTVSESIAGMLKDFVIYILCYKYLGRMVIHMHGGAGMRLLMSSRYPVLSFINRFFVSKLAAVVVLGDRLRSIYDGVVPQNKLHIVQNFASEDLLIDSKDIAIKFSSVNTLRILFLSNHLPGKGHFELLSALSKFNIKDRNRLHIDFAGGFESQSDEDIFRKLVSDLGGINIHVHGVVGGKLKRDLLLNAHIFCLPTYYPYEGQPISILEAYASGCAVITTDHSGIFDIFKPGLNGIEVLPRNSESIFDAINQAFEHPEAFEKYAQYNRNCADKLYRPAAHLKALEDVIFSVNHG